MSLAHDLGHTPFGHAGQDALNECMKSWGGFEHNLQSLRVVDELEQRYGAFDGLNLCFETREGILKHCSRVEAARLGELGARFLNGGQPSLEAQVANLADEIAYNNHDVDDGLRSGLITLADLEEVELFARRARQARAEFPELSERRVVHEAVRRIINDLVADLLAETLRRITEAGVQSVEDVRAAPALVAFSEEVRAQSVQLKRFLFARLYRHPRVVAVMDDARRAIQVLFEEFRNAPELLPAEHRDRVALLGPRAIADYIAGMTDRFAVRELERLGRLSALGELARFGGPGALPPSIPGN